MAMDFLAGCVGGCAGVIVGHPFDTVKVQLQTQDPFKPRYNGTFDCLRQIIAKESIRGLYKGICSPIAGVAAVNAIVFGVYGNIQKRHSNPESLGAHFWAGCAAGGAQSVICAPMELIKTRLQLQDDIKGVQKHTGPLDCIKSVWKTQGTRGLYRGFGITAARDLPGFSSYFVAYELMVQTKHASTFQILMAGGLAGVFSWIVTFPIDVVKTRMQIDGFNPTKQYKNSYDCFTKSYNREGWRFLTKGIGSTIIRAFPMNAVCFLVVTQIIKYTNVTKTTEVEMEARNHHKNNNKDLTVTSAKKKTQKRYKLDTDMDYIYRVKSNTIKGLTLMGSFHEDSINKAEIHELTNDFFAHDDDDEDCLDFGKALKEDRVKKKK